MEYSQENIGEANEKLRAALALFTDLNMPQEQDNVKKDLEELQGES